MEIDRKKKIGLIYAGTAVLIAVAAIILNNNVISPMINPSASASAASSTGSSTKSFSSYQKSSEPAPAASSSVSSEDSEISSDPLYAEPKELPGDGLNGYKPSLKVDGYNLPEKAQNAAYKPNTSTFNGVKKGQPANIELGCEDGDKIPGTITLTDDFRGKKAQQLVQQENKIGGSLNLPVPPSNMDYGVFKVKIKPYLKPGTGVNYGFKLDCVVYTRENKGEDLVELGDCIVDKKPVSFIPQTVQDNMHGEKNDIYTYYVFTLVPKKEEFFLGFFNRFDNDEKLPVAVIQPNKN